MDANSPERMVVPALPPIVQLFGHIKSGAADALQGLAVYEGGIQQFVSGVNEWVTEFSKGLTDAVNEHFEALHVLVPSNMLLTSVGELAKLHSDCPQANEEIEHRYTMLMYLVSASGVVYESQFTILVHRFRAALAKLAQHIAPGTVLDGEVVINRRQKRPIFIIFDVLCSGNNCLAKLPFQERLRHLQDAR